MIDDSGRGRIVLGSGAAPLLRLIRTACDRGLSISTTASWDVASRHAWLAHHGATQKKWHPSLIAKIKVTAIIGSVELFDVRTDKEQARFGVLRPQSRFHAARSHEVTLRGTIPRAAIEIIRIECARCKGPCRSIHGFSNPKPVATA